MDIAIILAVLFAVLGIIFLCGKGSFLIAGYNTASDEEKAKYDEKRLHLCFSIFCFALSITIGIMAYIDTESFALSVGMPIILGLIFLLVVFTSTYCKKNE
jgi:drug/metabolite transporter (DMT)-like permease